MQKLNKVNFVVGRVGRKRSSFSFFPDLKRKKRNHVVQRSFNFNSPIHDPYLRSWGPLAAINLNLIVEGVLIPRSRLSRSLKPCKVNIIKDFENVLRNE